MANGSEGKGKFRLAPMSEPPMKKVLEDALKDFRQRNWQRNWGQSTIPLIGCPQRRGSEDIHKSSNTAENFRIRGRAVGSGYVDQHTQ